MVAAAECECGYHRLLGSFGRCARRPLLFPVFVRLRQRQPLHHGRPQGLSCPSPTTGLQHDQTNHDNKTHDPSMGNGLSNILWNLIAALAPPF